jgi:hypothetical protein
MGVSATNMQYDTTIRPWKKLPHHLRSPQMTDTRPELLPVSNASRISRPLTAPYPSGEVKGVPLPVSEATSRPGALAQSRAQAPGYYPILSEQFPVILPDQQPPCSTHVPSNANGTYPFRVAMNAMLFEKPKASSESADLIIDRFGELSFELKSNDIALSSVENNNGRKKKRLTKRLVPTEVSSAPEATDSMKEPYRSELYVATGLADQSLTDFLEHSRLFFEMSIPLFKTRLGLADNGRPSPALLHAMVCFSPGCS